MHPTTIIICNEYPIKNTSFVGFTSKMVPSVSIGVGIADGLFVGIFDGEIVGMYVCDVGLFVGFCVGIDAYW